MADGKGLRGQTMYGIVTIYVKLSSFLSRVLIMGVRASRLTKLVGDRRYKQVGFTPLTPKGYVPVRVGVNDDTRQFIVHRKTLCDKDFSDMLCKSAEEYGFCNEGVLRIRCEAKDFEEWIMRRTKRKIFVLLENLSMLIG
ncbi:hypothetical protein F3Y22_tig00110931pilonHSYRG00252 [Hibiscus syriacus]|uniref:Uncharacterized protein n=1 Tax=Hibiscus syriacus TaxID=106335 RepID=A0A6A2ZFL2_HIBSY|nr:hypothetical protein F3Y22_tig00110931pilonHSYRG00252 [Hibiscus syriacus]